jgi:hypothetical protein
MAGRERFLSKQLLTMAQTWVDRKAGERSEERADR